MDTLGEKNIYITWEQWQDAKIEADKRMKASNGHYYEVMLKTRCVFCRKSPKDTRRCGAWFQTFIMQLDNVLLNIDK